MYDQQGYYFHPPGHSPGLGYPKLDIYLSAKPGDRFFDSREARFSVVTGDGVSEIAVEHPWQSWAGPDRRRLCAGRFVLYAHDEEVVEGFSFGGDLEIINHDEYTICHLTSAAPLFNLADDPESPDVILVNLLEQLIAQRRAAWGADDPGFEERLAQADPFLLFVASLAILRERYSEASLAEENATYQQLADAISRAVRRVKKAGEWPAVVPSLAELL